MRFPRLVSWNTYCAATRALPAEQRKAAKRMRQLQGLLANHIRLKRALTVKHIDCESLKRLLPPEVLATWKAERKAENEAAKRLGRGDGL